jgi:hypothetical protein
MLLQTNSYVVPKEKRTEHARLLARFRQTLGRLGCDHFEVYEQTGVNWASAEGSGRFVQIMRFRDRNHQRAVQDADKNDPQAQALIREFCALIDFPAQQQAGKFVVGYYTSALPVSPLRSGIAPSPAPAVPAVPAPPQVADEATAELPPDLPPEIPAVEPGPAESDETLSGAMISEILDEEASASHPESENGEPLGMGSSDVASEGASSATSDNGNPNSGLEFLADSDPQPDHAEQDAESEKQRREHSL